MRPADFQILSGRLLVIYGDVMRLAVENTRARLPYKLNCGPGERVPARVAAEYYACLPAPAAGALQMQTIWKGARAGGNCASDHCARGS